MNNRYSEFDDDELQEYAHQWIAIEEWEEFGQILTDLEFLEAKIGRISLDELLSDYAEALRVLPEEKKQWDKLAILKTITGDQAYFLNKLRKQLVQLRRAFEREAHHLHGWDHAGMPAYFLQQVCNWTDDIASEKLRINAKALLTQRKAPYLLVSWRTSSASSALERTFVGHDTFVSDVAITPDGLYAVSGSMHGLKLWDLQRGQDTGVFYRHSYDVAHVAVTPDGQYVLSAEIRVRSDLEKKLVVWNLQTGQEEHVLNELSGKISALTVTPDGGRVLVGYRDGTIKVWNLSAGYEQYRLRSHSKSINKIAITGDGAWAVSASEDETLKVWSLRTGREERTLRAGSSGVHGISIIPNSHYVIDSVLRIWDVETGRILMPGREIVFDVVATPDRQHAISTWLQFISVWNLQTGKKEQTFYGHAGSLRTIALTPDGQHVISASNDYTLKIWNLQANDQRKGVHGHVRAVSAVVITADGQHAVSASLDETLKIWDLRTGREKCTLQSGRELRKMILSADGRRAITASSLAVQVWNLQTRQEEYSFSSLMSATFSLAILPDGHHLISVFADQSLVVWDLQTGQEAGRLKSDLAEIHAIAVTPDARYVISACRDSTVRVWDIQKQQEKYILSGHGQTVHAVAVTPDGQYAVSASWDGTLKVWDLHTGQMIYTLQSESTALAEIAVTPDGCYAISAYEKLSLWNLQTGIEEYVFPGHASKVRALAVTQDSHRAVSVSEDGILKVWDLKVGRELATAALDGVLTCVAIAPDPNTFIVGDGVGNVYCLRYTE